MVVALVLQIMPDLETMCEGPVSPLSLERLEVDSLVPSVVAWAPTSPPLEPRQMSADEESVALDAGGTHSPESIGHVVPVGDDDVVAGVPVPNLGDMFAIKFVEFLTNLDSAKSKAFGCHLGENAQRDKCNGGAHLQSGIRKKKSSKCKGKKVGDNGEAQVVS